MVSVPIFHWKQHYVCRQIFLLCEAICGISARDAAQLDTGTTTTTLLSETILSTRARGSNKYHHVYEIVGYQYVLLSYYLFLMSSVFIWLWSSLGYSRCYFEEGCLRDNSLCTTTASWQNDGSCLCNRGTPHFQNLTIKRGRILTRGDLYGCFSDSYADKLNSIFSEYTFWPHPASLFQLSFIKR